MLGGGGRGSSRRFVLLTEIYKRLMRDTKAREQLNTRYSLLRDYGKLQELDTQIFREVGRYNLPKFWLAVSLAYSSHSP